MPLGSDVQTTAEPQTIAKIKVYPGANATFTLYDDDGKTTAYEKGEGIKLTTLKWNDKTKKLSGSNAPVEVAGK